MEYKPVLNETPLKLNVGEYTINVPDAPSSGPVLALILNIVDGESHIVSVCVLASRISRITRESHSLAFPFILMADLQESFEPIS